MTIVPVPWGEENRIIIYGTDCDRSCFMILAAAALLHPGPLNAPADPAKKFPPRKRDVTCTSHSIFPAPGGPHDQIARFCSGVPDR